jgi:hypothetical protein
MQDFALNERPLLKLGVVVEKELLEKLAPVQVGRLLQVRRALSTRGRLGVLVCVTGREMGIESCHVEGMAARGVELNFTAGDDQEGRFGRPVADRLADIEEGLPQVVPCSDFGAVGPQEPGQLLSPMGVIRFAREVYEERARFVRSEGRNRRIVQHNLQRSQKTQLQAGNRPISSLFAVPGAYGSTLWPTGADRDYSTVTSQTQFQ